MSTLDGDNSRKPTITDNLPGYIKVSFADALLRRVEETHLDNIYFFRIKSKGKVIHASKGVKPLSPEGREALSITPQTIKTIIRKNLYNYGAYAFEDGLCFVDFDMDPSSPGNTVVPFDKISEFAQTLNTFGVKTRSGGYQFYFQNPGLADNPHIYYSPDKHQDGEPLIDAGELRCKNQYVVCPGSYVPKQGPKGFSDDATGVYEVVWDSPIQVLDLNLIFKQFPWFKLNDPTKDAVQQRKKQMASVVNIDTNQPISTKDDTITIASHGVSLAKIRARDPVLDELLDGPDRNQKFPSGSEADESAIFRLLKNGFSDQQVFNIMMTHRYRPKFDRHDYLITSIAHAKDKIIETHDDLISKNCTDLPVSIVAELPENLPSWIVTLLKTGPRTGKTFRAIMWAIQSGNANYLAATHETVANALNIFRRIISTRPDKQHLMAVHTVGKELACNENDLNKNCQHCPKCPHDTIDEGSVGITFMELQKEAHELLREKKILTVKDIPQEMCPYYTLHLAQEIADICFTVPYYHNTSDKIKSLKERELLIVDEDTTTRSFYPVCIELANEYRTKDGYSIQNLLSQKMMWFIEKLEQKVSEQCEGKRRITTVNKTIMELCSKLKLVNTYMKAAIENNSPESIARMHELIKTVDFSNNLEDETKHKILRKIDEYSKDIHKTNSDAAQLFEPLLYPATSQFDPLHAPALAWIGGRRNGKPGPSTLFAISEHTLLFVPKFQKMVVIGGTEAEIFVKDVTDRLEIEKNEIKTITMQNFKYSNNYVFFEIFDPEKEKKIFKHPEIEDTEEGAPENLDNPDDEIEETMNSSQYLWKLIHLYSETNRKYQQKTPFLLLTSTTESQSFVTDHLGGGSIACTDHRIDEIHNNWATGRGNVFYQNSIISRGLDIPFYHMTFVYSCNFATPYWTAMRDHYRELMLQPAQDGADQEKEEKNYEALRDKIAELENIIRRIQMDETTNGILRTAPVPGKFEDHIKIVVYSERHKTLVSGAQYSGVTIIPVPTTTPIDPLISVFRRLIDPVMTRVADEKAEHIPARPFRPAGIDEAKALITQHMNNYQEAIESYNLPIERVGTEILSQPTLGRGQKCSEDTLVNYCFQRTSSRINKKTIRKVIARMAETNILKSSMSTIGELHRMYQINENILSQLSDEATRKDTISSLLSFV